MQTEKTNEYKLFEKLFLKYLKVCVNMLKVRLVLLAVTLTILIQCQYFPFANFIIPQNGMFPNLPRGTKLIAKKNPYKSITEIKKGDIILFNVHGKNGKFIYIWRVIGLPGDSVLSTKDKLVINGIEIKKTLLQRDSSTEIYNEVHSDSLNFKIAYDLNEHNVPPDISIKVPDNAVFVLGDNRLSAVDSRYSGPVLFKDIIGKVLIHF